MKQNVEKEEEKMKTKTNRENDKKKMNRRTNGTQTAFKQK